MMMRSINNVEALVLASRSRGRNCRQLEIFSYQQGRLLVTANINYRHGVVTAAALQPFTRAIFTLTDSTGGFSFIRQAEIIDSNQWLRSGELLRSAYACQLSEFIINMWPLRQPDAKAWEILTEGWRVMTERNPRIVALAAGWQLMAVAGYQPDLNYCCFCGKMALAGSFMISKSALVCSECRENSIGEEQAVVLIDQLIKLNWRQIPAIRLSQSAVAISEQWLADYYRQLTGCELLTSKYIVAIN